VAQMRLRVEEDLGPAQDLSIFRTDGGARVAGRFVRGEMSAGRFRLARFARSE
jgi:hypothetical protein